MKYHILSCLPRPRFAIQSLLAELEGSLDSRGRLIAPPLKRRRRGPEIWSVEKSAYVKGTEVITVDRMIFTDVLNTYMGCHVCFLFRALRRC